MTQYEKENQAINEILKELYHAQEKYPPAKTMLEGLVIVTAQYNKLIEKAHRSVSHPEKMRQRAVQLASSAFRFIFDCCCEKKP